MYQEIFIHDAAVKNRLQEQEVALSNLDHTKCVILDCKGSLLWETNGYENTVNLTKADEAGLLENNIVIYNHLQGSGISQCDVEALLVHNLQEVRVVTSTSIFLVKLKKDYRFLSEDERMELYEDFRDMCEDQQWYAVDECQDKVKNGIFTEQDAEREYNHIFMDGISSRVLYLDYKRSNRVPIH